jgi:hypothetical protein
MQQMLMLSGVLLRLLCIHHHQIAVKRAKSTIQTAADASLFFGSGSFSASPHLGASLSMNIKPNIYIYASNNVKKCFDPSINNLQSGHTLEAVTFGASNLVPA